MLALWLVCATVTVVGVCEGYSRVIKMWFRMYHMQQAAALHTL